MFQNLMNWYFEKCRLSHLLIGMVILWALLAWMILRELAPLAYVGLHVVTTGVFFLAALRVDRQSHQQHE